MSPSSEDSSPTSSGTYTCGIGEPGYLCGEPAVGIIAVHTHPDIDHVDDAPTRSVLLMCRKHFNHPLGFDTMPHTVITPNGAEVDHICVFRAMLREVAKTIGIPCDENERYDSAEIFARLHRDYIVTPDEKQRDDE